MRSKPPLTSRKTPSLTRLTLMESGLERNTLANRSSEMVSNGLAPVVTLIEITHTRTPRLVTSNRLTAVLFAMRQEEMYAIRDDWARGLEEKGENGYGGGDPVFSSRTKRKTSK